MKAANSVTLYSRFFSLSNVRTVLDYGAGTLRNALHLAEHGFIVYATDLPEQVKVLQSHPRVRRLAGLLDIEELERKPLGVDLVLSTYVFNVIDKPTERRRYLQNAAKNLRPGGHLLMEMCHRLDGVENGGEERKDAEHAHNYGHRQLDELLHPYGFRRICHYYSDHALAAIYRLEPAPKLSQRLLDWG